MDIPSLGKNELKLLRCIASGDTYSEIGSRMFKSGRTIEARARKLRVKLQAKNNAHLVSIAYEEEILLPRIK